MVTELIILFIISYIAASISGAAGFGGALILLPFVVNIVGVKAAVPILTIASIFGNTSRVWFGRFELKWKPIIYFLLTAIPLTILGSYLFTDINSKIVKICIGIVLILLVGYRRLKIKKIVLGEKGMLVGGGLTGFLSGLIGSAGPIGAAFFLGLNLTATAYVASEAFAALAMHLTKTVVYSKYSLIGIEELYYGLFIGAAMVLGSWTGRKIIEKISRDKFIILVEILLIITGIQMIWTA
ncbi:sulfite exporter TauE/SafE family protein [Gaoshiqia sediminis]|uniref:Probable membrane transporter protein n=1 Tax=Gaoshiqia sediminis TaxID=2986998 RepID=A0AA42C7J2_9BACT|nr:sulfite exporter TauE/SafE family protein [Gaoshiqia sediminis]MCW0485043.1 sulfite exporter TauE/SafE family protein [Gaoshiqia sediminis]